MLPTKVKIAVARALNRAIVGARTLTGRDANVEVRRAGIRWRLDLNEGIDLAIYLGLYQSIPERLANECIRPDAVVVDIGANIGSHSLPLARRVGPAGRVVAIEPTDYAFAKLVANVGINGDIAGRLVPVQAMLGDGSGAVSDGVYSRWPLRETAGDRHAVHLGLMESARDARFGTLDDLLAELRASGRISGPVSFVKLDVDGNELGVLRGGAQTFSGDRPPILIEIAPYVQDEVSGRFEELLATLTQYGYRLEYADTGKPMPMQADALRALVRPGSSIDALARPVR